MVIKLSQNFIDHHVSFVYENVCMELMWKLNTEGAFGFVFDKVGRWWDSKTEIDIMALDTRGNEIIFGECKYIQKPMDVDVFYELEKKSKSVLWKNNDWKEKFVLFSISGHTERLRELSEMRGDILLYK